MIPMQTLSKSLLQIKLGYNPRGDFTMGQQNECTSLKDKIAQVPSEYQSQLGEELRRARAVTVDLLGTLGASNDQTVVEKLGAYASQMPEFTLLTEERKTALAFIQQVCSKQLDIPTGITILRDTLRQFDEVLENN